jgi:hypothetical protein
MARFADPAVFGAMLEQSRADAAEFRVDAVDTLIPSRNVEQILAEVLRDEFGPRYSSRYIPIGPFGVQPWADRFIQLRYTRQGMLDYVFSADMPTGDVTGQEITHKLYTLGGKVEMSWFEQQTANYAGVNVMGEKLMERREAAEDTKDTILISGDGPLQKSGYIAFGLINHPDVPVAAPTTGNWATATAAQIITDVQDLVVLHRQQSRRLEQPDTLLLPEAQYAILESTQVPNTNMTIRSWLLANIAGLTTIDVLPELAGAGAAGADRALLYSKNDRVLRGILPMDFSFIAEEVSKMRTYIWGVMRMVGLVIKKPFAMVYADGI